MNDPVVAVEHPAKYSPEVMAVLRARILAVIRPHGLVLDPFGGVGRIHDVCSGSYAVSCAVEIEPEWADQSRLLGLTYCADFLAWADECHPDAFDVVATSCTYGNRMADHHNAKDDSKRITYKHKLGRDLTPGNSGALQFGDEYKLFHLRAWTRVKKVLKPGGTFLLNVSDFVRKGEVVPVTAWHKQAITALGFQFIREFHVETRRMGFGANGKARVPYEVIYEFRKVG